MIKRKHFKYKFYPPHTLHQHEGVYATNDGIHDSLGEQILLRIEPYQNSLFMWLIASKLLCLRLDNNKDQNLLNQDCNLNLQCFWLKLYQCFPHLMRAIVRVVAVVEKDSEMELLLD